MTSSLAVFEAAIRVKSVHLIKSCLKQNVEIKEFLHKAPSERLFSNGIHSFLSRADAKGNDDIIYRI